MRAFVKDRFEDAGSVREVADPTPAPGEVRVRVRAASVNPVDASAAAGYLKDYMEHRFPYIPGLDLSGVIDVVGVEVKDVAMGDEVFGTTAKSFFGAGSFAELATAAAASVFKKPASIDHAAASTAGLAAVTALAALELIDAKAGQVVVGGSGGVGSYVVQLLASQGTRVVAIASGERAAYLRGLGASETIDYKSSDVAARLSAAYPGGIDALVHLAGEKDAFAPLAARVRDGGRIASITGAADADALKARGIVAQNVNGMATRERLSRIAGLLADGTVKPPAIRTMTLEQAAEALAQAGSRHAQGKIVLAIS